MTSFDLVLFLVFFIYGFAFLTLGITFAVESGRFSALADAKVFRPLAIFGLFHGTHEWVEAYLIQADALIPIARLVALAKANDTCSFLCFSIIFDIQAFRLKVNINFNWCPGFKGFGVYVIILSFITLGRFPCERWHGRTSLNPSSLSFGGTWGHPGCFQITAPGGRVQWQRATLPSHPPDCGSHRFRIYGLAQSFLSPVDMFPVDLFNSAVFREWVGFPIQMVRPGRLL